MKALVIATGCIGSIVGAAIGLGIGYAIGLIVVFLADLFFNPLLWLAALLSVVIIPFQSERAI